MIGVYSRKALFKEICYTGIHTNTDNGLAVLSKNLLQCTCEMLGNLQLTTTESIHAFGFHFKLF